MSGKEQDEEGKDNAGMTRGTERERETERETERERERERAGQIWATVTLGRWLWALSSVYITLTDQAKNSQETRVSSAAQWSWAGERLPSVCEYVFSPHMQWASATLKYLSFQIHSAFVSCYMCLSSQAQANCLLFSRGQGLVGLQSTQ